MNGLLLAVVVAAMNVTYEPAPVAQAFMDCNEFVRVIHGPVGSGKSSCCVVEILSRSVAQEPNGAGVRDTRWAVVRNTYRELKDTTRQTFDQWVGVLGKWNKSDFAFDLDVPMVDGTRCRAQVLFRALDSPDDVRKLLSLEITGAYVNELREIPKIILDGLTMRVGRYPSKKDGGATWLGIWADTNPWAETSEYAELFANPPEGFALFRQPSGLSPEAENVENLPAGYYARMCAGKDSEWIDEYVHGKNPKADKGSIYGGLLAALEQRGGVSDFAHPTDGVFATFDLGVSDATAIWWWRLNQHGMPDLIDWYEATGQGASHYFAVLDGETPPGVDRPRAYSLSRIWLPHDARARTFQTGVSTLEKFLEHYPGRVAIAPELSIDDGISASRWALEQPTRIHSRCADGLKRLRAYKYEWDETRKVFSKRPLHDWTSHTADAFRYVASAVKASELLAPKPKPPPKPIEAKPYHYAFSLNDLWRANGRGR